MRSGAAAGSQARFVYVREERDFIGAAAPAPPPRLAPGPPFPGPAGCGDTPLARALLPATPPAPACAPGSAQQRAAGARPSRRLLRKPW